MPARAETLIRWRTFFLVRTYACVTCGFDSFAYRSLEAIEACPSNSRRDTRSAPCSSRLDAHV
jgi:hypothetical protein